MGASGEHDGRVSFELQAARTPDATAVLTEDSSLSYGELNARADHLAHHLCGLGVGPGTRVAICVERGLQMIVGLMGILKAGGVSVVLDPSHPGERMRHFVEDSASSVLLTQGHPRELFWGSVSGLRVIDLEEADEWSAEPEVNLDVFSLGRTAGGHLKIPHVWTPSAGTQ
jgi:non-ribosomal peptide synthetase component F